MKMRTSRLGDGENGTLVILFDGVCNLCTGTVRFVIARDPKRRFRFASLQSEAAKALLESHGLPRESLENIVVIDGARSFIKSDAALYVAGSLKGLWPVLRVFRIVPRRVRDAVYDFVARRRYRWFGKRQACLVPAPEDAHRFIE